MCNHLTLQVHAELCLRNRPHPVSPPGRIVTRNLHVGRHKLSPNTPRLRPTRWPSWLETAVSPTLVNAIQQRIWRHWRTCRAVAWDQLDWPQFAAPKWPIFSTESDLTSKPCWLQTASEP